MSNASKADYTDLDVWIRPDVPIAHIAQESAIGNVSFVDYSRTQMAAAVVGPQGGQAHPTQLQLLATNDGYRVLADKLRGEAFIDIVAALVSVKPNEKGILAAKFKSKPDPTGKPVEDGEWTYWYRSPEGPPNSDRYFGSRQVAKKVLLKGTFKAAGRTHTIDSVVTPMVLT